MARESIVDVCSPSDTAFESALDTLVESESALESVPEMLELTARAAELVALAATEPWVALESAVEQL